MKVQILEKLQAIEEEKEICILFALESGSRGWGFPSPDSDYDVRFIYVRPKDWYLSLIPGRDTLEFPISDLLDISGWDLKKCLLLVQKSNAVVWEWLQSPVLYRDCQGFRKNFFELLRPFFSLKTSFFHYVSMAQGNWKDLGGESEIKLKKYFYVLRPLLAARWICENQSIPPMEFQNLLNVSYVSSEVKEDIQSLVAKKGTVGEGYRNNRNPKLDEFVQINFEWFENKGDALPATSGNTEILNRYFLDTLERWT